MEFLLLLVYIDTPWIIFDHSSLKLLTSKIIKGVHSNLGCRDTVLKIVSLLKNYRSEWGKSIHFWKALCTGFSKIPKSLP